MAMEGAGAEKKLLTHFDRRTLAKATEGEGVDAYGQGLVIDTAALRYSAVKVTSHSITVVAVV
jgi:hypothetical protein